MRKIVSEFFRRGMAACGIGPLVLAVLYWILQQNGVVTTLTVNRVCLGIISLSVLAFVAGGMNVVYQIERLPLMVAISIHGGVLYVSYLATYLLNSWLEWGTAPVLVFSGIFLVGYLVIWMVIYAIIKRNTDMVNKMLKEHRGEAEQPGEPL